MRHELHRRDSTRHEVLVRLVAGLACIGAGVMVQAFENDPKTTSVSNSASVATDPKVGGEEGAVDPNSQDASQRIGGSFQNQGYKDPREELTNERHAFKTPFGQVIWKDIDKRLSYRDNSTYVTYNGFNLKLTIQPQLQHALEKTLASQRNIAGAVVILESRTGRILAMAESKADVKSPLVTDDSILTTARAPAAAAPAGG